MFLFFFFLFSCSLLSASDTAGEYNFEIQQLWDQKEYAGSMEIAEEGIKKFPYDTELLGRLGYCYKLLEREDFGISKIEKAYSMDRNNQYIKIWLADAYLGFAWHNAGEPDKAKELAEKAMDINLEYSWPLYSYAGLLFNLGDIQGWACNLEKFLNMENDTFVKEEEINVRENLACYYVSALQSLSNGRRHLEHLIEHYPEHPHRDGWENQLEWYNERTITITLTYRVTGSKNNPVELILPVRNSYQKYVNYEFDPAPADYTLYNIGGNTCEKLHYMTQPEKIVVTLDMLLQPRTVTEGGFICDDTDDLPDKYRGYYVDNGVELNPSDRELLKLTGEIVKGEKDPYKKALLIHKWIMKNFTYKVVFPPTIREYLASREGECGGYALVFVALCRTAGIPARRVFSPLFEYPDGKTFGSHETSEFYIEGKGWIPVNNTSDVFGSTSKVLNLWREGTGYVIYPDFKSIRVKYRTNKGNMTELTGG